MKLKLHTGPLQLGQPPRPKVDGQFFRNSRKPRKGADRPQGKPRSPGGSGPSPKGGKQGPRGLFPTGPLSYKDFLREQHSAENLQFSPLQRELDREGAASNFRRTQEDPAWFNQFRQEIQQGGQQTQAAYGSALDRIQNFSAQQGQQDASSRSALADKLSQDAALRGTAVDPSVLANGQNAESARQNLLATMHGTIAGQGANQAAFQNNRVSIGSQLQREAQGKELARLLGINEDQRKLQQERGDFRTKYRADTRDAERKYDLGLRTLKGENQRANLSANTSTANNIRSTNTSAANSKRSSATSRSNNANSTAQTEANRKAQNRRDRKNRRERRWAHNHPQAKAGKGGASGHFGG